MKYGVGKWVQILETGLLPGKLIQQLNGQAQRLLGQQSLAGDPSTSQSCSSLPLTSLGCMLCPTSLLSYAAAAINARTTLAHRMSVPALQHADACKTYRSAHNNLQKFDKMLAVAGMQAAQGSWWT